MRVMWIVVSGLLWVSSVGWAERYYVEAASGPGASESDCQTLTALVKTSIQGLSHEVVSEVSQSDFILRPRLLKLGEAYVISLDKVKGGKVLYSDRLKAARIEEFDQIVNRLTRSVAKETTASKDVRVAEVSKTEQTEGTARRPALKGFYLGLGPAGLGHLNRSGLGYYFSGAYAWDVTRAIVRARADFAGNGKAFFLDFGFGLSYFLSDADLAPFVGADFGYGMARVDRGSYFGGERIYGFVMGPVVGVHLLRTSAVNLEFALRAVALLGSGPFGSPLMCGARVGLYF